MEHFALKTPCSPETGWGGDQNVLPGATLRRWGCGAVAGLDLVRYLSKTDPGRSGDFFAAGEDYAARVSRFSRRFVPVLPGFGVNGLVLALGVDRFFRKYRMPFTARWGVRQRALSAAIGDMLARDIPVVLAIGPNFPRFWQKHGLKLYAPVPGGEPRAALAVRAHYVTVIGMEGDWLQAVSWGRPYALRLSELEAYARRHSLGLFCSVLRVRRRRRRG